jgi:predicted Zn-dependent peptidase
MRALRQLLGPWRKSEQLIPATFRQPIPPDTKVLVITGSGDAAELRLAFRGVARSDPDYYPALVLAKLTQHRWESLMPELTKRPTFARSESHFLPGMFVIGSAVNSADVADALATAKKTVEGLSSTIVSPAEIDRARNEVLTELNSMLSKPDAPSEALLDSDTYRLTDTQNPSSIITAVTPADIQRLAARLFNTPVATVVLGDTQQLKAALQGRVPFEVLGEVAVPPKPKPTPPKPETKPTPK